MCAFKWNKREEHKMRKITESAVQAFRDSLFMDEKSRATVSKYIQAVRRLAVFLGGEELTKLRLLEYREHLQSKNKAQTVNGALSAISAFLDFCGWQECRIKLLKVQHQVFAQESRELSEAEYKRLLQTAKDRKNKRLYMLMLTLCGTGIRIGELEYITVEAVRRGRAEIRMKGKNRMVILQKELRKKLLKYVKEQGIEGGYIFRTRSGKPMDRSNICHDMKKLCAAANVEPGKVFPHNLRHLFARTFYAIEKNLAHLADVLGHSRIETTRIYVAVSAAIHERTLSRMRLVI